MLGFIRDIFEERPLSEKKKVHQKLKKKNKLGTMRNRKGLNLYRRDKHGVHLVEIENPKAYVVGSDNTSNKVVRINPDDRVVWASNMSNAIRKLYPEYNFKTKTQKKKMRELINKSKQNRHEQS